MYCVFSVFGELTQTSHSKKIAFTVIKQPASKVNDHVETNTKSIPLQHFVF